MTGPVGYFAFQPPPLPLWKVLEPTQDPVCSIISVGTTQESGTNASAPPSNSSDALQLASTGRTRGELDGNDDLDNVRRTHQKECESAARKQSEIEWVRAGGVLRDAHGGRDKTRTEGIRAEIRLQEDGRRKLQRWERYEARCRALAEAASPLTFFDFPWPLLEPLTEKRVEMLTTSAVGSFLFESLNVKGCSSTRRDRIRTSLLRWHPDKVSSLLNRVVPEDIEIVREGIHRVFRSLKTLQDAQRTVHD
ncbi:hypothetical protein ID866_6359 [Astraeus odoratus]|nr:hypothetical protein ID866_6359 [Astraeus odoratus]